MVNGFIQRWTINRKDRAIKRKEVEQINDPSNPIDLRMEQSPVVASYYPVSR